MKQETNIARKQQGAVKGKATPFIKCGTLSYLAECRGTVRKTELYRCSAPTSDFNKINRK